MGEVTVYGRYEWRCPSHGLQAYQIDAGSMVPIVGPRPCTHHDGEKICGVWMQPTYLKAGEHKGTADG